MEQALDITDRQRNRGYAPHPGAPALVGFCARLHRSHSLKHGVLAPAVRWMVRSSARLMLAVQIDGWRADIRGLSVPTSLPKLQAVFRRNALQCGFHASMLIAALDAVVNHPDSRASRSASISRAAARCTGCQAIVTRSRKVLAARRPGGKKP
jgi:hypothetical protein